MVELARPASGSASFWLFDPEPQFPHVQSGHKSGVYLVGLLRQFNEKTQCLACKKCSIKVIQY